MPPVHPGETIREDVLPALGLSVTEAAEQLGISRVSFSRVINGKAAISPIMARRLEAWLKRAGARTERPRDAGASSTIASSGRDRPRSTKRR